ncbi:MAG: class I SAM-dependent methyltransferase [Gemmatimonadaceae bacterium]|nr:class I SAM-dependent methyltransferase [Gemmatimonadaceae bacterium]
MALRTSLRSLARRLGRVIPVKWRLRAIEGVLRLQEPGVRRLYNRTAVAPNYLTIDDLDALAREFPVERQTYLYDADTLEKRGEERARPLLDLVAGKGTFLEIGAADGMVLRAIAQRGHTAIGVDILASNLDARAREAGVRFIQTDATRLCFPDESVDVVYSFATFEHLPDPDATFAEIVRVLKKGGYACIDFAGLGWTYRGAHMYKTFGIPFITALFTRETIDRYVAEHQLPHYFPSINNWPIERFREVFRKYEPQMERIRYSETKDRFHFRFIRRFMPHLRRAPSFDSLLVDQVEGLFRKR